MPEQNLILPAQLAGANHVDHPPHGSTRVDRIEQDPFCAGGEQNRLSFQLSNDTIAGSQVAGIENEFPFRELMARVNQGGGAVGKRQDLMLESVMVGIFFVDFYAYQLVALPKYLLAQHEARLGAAGARGEDDVGKRMFSALLVQLTGCRSKGNRSKLVRAAVRDDVWVPACRFHLCVDLRDAFTLAMLLRPVDPAAEDPVQQQIALQLVRALDTQDQVAFDAEFRCRCRCLPTMVRLCCAGRNDRIATLLERITQQVFNLPGLVPAERKAGLIISLHEDRRTAENMAQTRQLNNRRREKPE